MITILAQKEAANYPKDPEHISIGSYLILSVGAIVSLADGPDRDFQSGGKITHGTGSFHSQKNLRRR